MQAMRTDIVYHKLEKRDNLLFPSFIDSYYFTYTRWSNL